MKTNPKKFSFPALKHGERTSEAHGIHEILKDGNRVEPTNGEAIPGHLPKSPGNPSKGLGLCRAVGNTLAQKQQTLT